MCPAWTVEMYYRSSVTIHHHARENSTGEPSLRQTIDAWSTPWGTVVPEWHRADMEISQNIFMIFTFLILGFKKPKCWSIGICLYCCNSFVTLVQRQRASLSTRYHAEMLHQNLEKQKLFSSFSSCGIYLLKENVTIGVEQNSLVHSKVWSKMVYRKVQPEHISCAPDNGNQERTVSLWDTIPQSKHGVVPLLHGFCLTA